MMKKRTPVSVKELVISSWERRHVEGLTVRGIAEKYDLKKSTVHGIISKYRCRGTIENLKGLGKKPIFTPKEMLILANEIKLNRPKNVKKLTEKMKSLTGKKVSEQTIRNYLKKEDIRLKNSPKGSSATNKKTSSNKQKRGWRNVKISKQRSCLFCGASCSKEEGTLKGNFPGAVNCLLLKIQLQNYFILQRILEVGEPFCLDILKEVSGDLNQTGNDCSECLLNVCQTCLGLVDDAWKIYQQILALQVEFDLSRKKLKEMIKTKRKKEDDPFTVEDRIRKVVIGDLTQTNSKNQKQVDFEGEDNTSTVNVIKEEVFDAEHENQGIDFDTLCSPEEDLLSSVKDYTHDLDDSCLEMDWADADRIQSELFEAETVKEELQILQGPEHENFTENESKTGSAAGEDLIVPVKAEIRGQKGSNHSTTRGLRSTTSSKLRKSTGRKLGDGDFASQRKLTLRPTQIRKTYKSKLKIKSKRSLPKSVKMPKSLRAKYRKRNTKLHPGTDLISTDDFKYKCHLCGVPLKTEEMLKKHLELHLQRESSPDDAHLNCNQCSFPALNLEELENHKSSFHKPKPWHCPSLGCTYRSEFHFKVKGHVLKEHPELNEEEISNDPEKIKAFLGLQLKCSKCLREFKKPCRLLDHWKMMKRCQKKEKPDRYICEDCGAVFRNDQFAAFYSHRWTKHPYTQKAIDKINRRFICDICGLVYKGRRNLQDHHQKYHEGNDRGVKEASDKGSEEVFKCDYCDITSPFLVVIRRHEQIHLRSGEGGFKCGQCERGYRSDMALKRHVRINHPKKKIEVPCPHCNKIFIAKDYLRAHLNDHCPKLEIKTDGKQTQNDGETLMD